MQTIKVDKLEVQGEDVPQSGPKAALPTDHRHGYATARRFIRRPDTEKGSTARKDAVSETSLDVANERSGPPVVLRSPFAQR